MVQSYATGGANMPSHMGTLAPSGEYDWTFASIRPTRVNNPNSKSIGSAVFAQLTAECRRIYIGAIWRIRLNSCFLRPPVESTTQTANRSVQPFLHRSLKKSLYFTMGDPFPKIAPFPRGIWTHLRHDSLGPFKPTTQAAYRSVLTFFARMTAECPYTL